MADKSVVVHGVRGADETIVDLEQGSSFLTVAGSAFVVSIDGLTIANGSDADADAGAIEMLSTQSELWLTACVLRGNTATGDGVAGGALLVLGTLECVTRPSLPGLHAGGRRAAGPSLATHLGPLEIQSDGLRVLGMPAVDEDGTSTLEVDVSTLAAGTSLALQGLVGGELLPATTFQVH